MIDLTSLARRPDVRFVVLFASILAVSFTVVALQQVNDRLVEPYTAMIARLSGSLLALLGEDISVAGCDVRSPRFAVTRMSRRSSMRVISLLTAEGVSCSRRPAAEKLPRRATSTKTAISEDLSMPVQYVNLIHMNLYIYEYKKLFQNIDRLSA